MGGGFCMGPGKIIENPEVKAGFSMIITPARRKGAAVAAPGERMKDVRLPENHCLCGNGSRGSCEPYEVNTAGYFARCPVNRVAARSYLFVHKGLD